MATLSSVRDGAGNLPPIFVLVEKVRFKVYDLTAAPRQLRCPALLSELRALKTVLRPCRGSSIGHGWAFGYPVDLPFVVVIGEPRSRSDDHVPRKTFRPRSRLLPVLFVNGHFPERDHGDVIVQQPLTVDVQDIGQILRVRRFGSA